MEFKLVILNEDCGHNINVCVGWSHVPDKSEIEIKLKKLMNQHGQKNVALYKKVPVTISKEEVSAVEIDSRLLE